MLFESFKLNPRTRISKAESITFVCFQDGKRQQQTENTITFWMTLRILKLNSCKLSIDLSRKRRDDKKLNDCSMKRLFKMNNLRRRLMRNQLVVNDLTSLKKLRRAWRKLLMRKLILKNFTSKLMQKLQNTDLLWLKLKLEWKQLKKLFKQSRTPQILKFQIELLKWVTNSKTVESLNCNPNENQKNIEPSKNIKNEDSLSKREILLT